MSETTALIAVDESLGACATLPAAMSDDRDVLAGLLRAIINDGLRDVLNDKKQQALLTEWICKETDCPKLIARYGVRFFAIAAMRAGKLGGETASRYVADFLIKSKSGGQIYEGLRRFIAKFDKLVQGGVLLDERIKHLDPDGAELMSSLPAPLRAQAATMSALDRIESGLDALDDKVEELKNPQPIFKRFDFRRYDKRDQFIYETRMIPFIDRPNAFAALHAFMESNERFAWMVVHGGGGAGKSRLALEYCLNKAGGWDCGFLRRGADQPNWDRWRPQTPHLLVIDYPAADPTKVAKLIQALAARDSHLEMPVRVILLERGNDGKNQIAWRAEIEKGSDGVKAKRCEARDLPLEPVDDLWSIFQYFFEDADRALPDKSETLAQLEAIDPQKRPLFAAYLAEALARSDSPRQWDRESLVDHVLTKDEERYWWTEGPEDDVNRDRYRALAAVAVLCGGLPYAAIKTLCAQYPDAFPQDDNLRVCRRLHAVLGQRTDGNDGVPALEPDMLGERFVLKLLEDWSDGPNKMLADALLDAAAAHDAEKMIESLYRIQMDFPDDPAFAETGRLHQPGLAVALFAISTFNILAEALTPVIENAKQFLTSTDRITRITGARTSFNLIHDLPQSDMDAARDLYSELKTIAEQHNDEPVLSLAQAKAAFSLIHDLRKSDMDAARDLYAELKILAEQNNDEPEIRLIQAKAAVNLIDDLAQSDIDAARDLYAELKILAEQHNDEPDVRLRQAKAGVNLIDDLGQSDIDAARDLYVELKILAEQNNDEPEIRLRQAKAAANLINDLGQSDTDAARDLYAELKILAEQHNDEPEIRLIQAKAAVNLIDDLAQSDIDAARDLYAELKALAEQNSDEPQLRLGQAQAAVNLIDDLPQSDMDAARDLYADLQALADAHPNEQELFDVCAHGGAVTTATINKRNGDAAAEDFLKDVSNKNIDLWRAILAHFGINPYRDGRESD